VNWFDSIVSWLIPRLLVEGTSWERDWLEKEREGFLIVCKFFFPLVSAGYIAHFFMYDLRMGLEPIERWFAFRVSMTLLTLLTFAFYMMPVAMRARWYRLPAIVTCWALCLSQAFVALWHGREAWVVCFLFVIATMMLLRMSALNSFWLGAAIVATQTPVLLAAGASVSNISSGTIVTLGMVLVIRTSYLSEVRNFILNQENITAQKKINELNTDFAERIGAFIPRVIATRLQNHVNNDGKTILEASVDVLQARKRDVACLFSDIRGFTKGSRDLDQFISRSVMPEVKVCSDTVEKHNGIPRKVGDLIFAYFDDDQIYRNLLQAITAGVEIARANEDMNATSSEVDIRRYILISSGEAIVGNLGGLDSSIEITALGSPVNFLSRLDDLTKSPELANMLDSGDIIVCERSAALLGDSNLDLKQVDLGALGLEVRDFSEVKFVYTLKPSEANLNALAGEYTKLDEEISDPRKPDRVYAA
jgi:class 3 adenylate cyclase